MRVVFRVDSSLQMGIGHVMRCLTLADVLTVMGVRCSFISRKHEGNINDCIRNRGYDLYTLPIYADTDSDLTHSKWLGAKQVQDAKDCAPILAELEPEWLVVDHYALDARWENLLATFPVKLMAIDDLADRQHRCSLLLDQTFGKPPSDYQGLVSSDCTVLCGSIYSILRPEFAIYRSYSIQRRSQSRIAKLLISFGGVDKDNYTHKVLVALQESQLPAHSKITVVMGTTAPWLNIVKEQAQKMRWPTDVLVGVNNMARIMAESDLAIGAAGATSWERCCVGLPTIMLVLAENQRQIANNLFNAKAAFLINQGDLENHNILPMEALNVKILSKMTQACAAIADGLGAERVASAILNPKSHAN